MDDLAELYGIDTTKGGGRLFADLVLYGYVLRHGTDYTVRDYACSVRREKRISPLVYSSMIKRACWQLFAAGTDELAEMGLREFANIYELAEAVIDGLPQELTEAGQELQRRAVERLQRLDIEPRKRDG